MRHATFTEFITFFKDMIYLDACAYFHPISKVRSGSEWENVIGLPWRLFVSDNETCILLLLKTQWLWVNRRNKLWLSECFCNQQCVRLSFPVVPHSLLAFHPWSSTIFFKNARPDLFCAAFAQVPVKKYILILKFKKTWREQARKPWRYAISKIRPTDPPT